MSPDPRPLLWRVSSTRRLAGVELEAFWLLSVPSLSFTFSLALSSLGARVVVQLTSNDVLDALPLLGWLTLAVVVPGWRVRR